MFLGGFERVGGIDTSSYSGVVCLIISAGKRIWEKMKFLIIEFLEKYKQVKAVSVLHGKISLSLFKSLVLSIQLEPW